ncbi:hypothetical protein [Thiohalophilus sp.]|uniref:hypothetical protein n=1 Tax=Thiohalophilus sp. TaxID=3028392 RepID=UPI002ACEF072|nr:hypothetical protein [Thiohalophilus sp.]MDZ7804409.1 hypothetical protein [Thiohalophilus sp.]
MRRLSAREILSVSNILTVILVSIILSQSINYFYVVYDLNLSKLLSVIFILLFTTVVLACKDTIRYVPEFFLMALPAVPVFFVHGYVNSGLLLIVLLGIAIANSHIKERAIYITYNLLFWTSVLIIVYGITITSDISFMRDEIYILPNQEITLFGNINKFTYLLVAMLSVFGYMFLANKITLISFISRFAVIFLIVAVVTQTRVSTVAVLFQVLIFLYAKNRKMSIQV